MNKIDLDIANGEAPVVADGPTLTLLISQIAAGAEARDRGEAPAHGAIDLVRGARLGAFRLSPPHGGGASLRDLFELVIALAEADSNVPHILRNHFAFVERALRSTSSEKYRRWLRDVEEGKIFGLGASELGTQNIGSGDSETELAPKGDDFVLNGRKYYSTGNLYSDFIYVNASTPEGSRVAAMVPTRSPGIDVDDDWDGVGQRLTASGTTVFTDVHVDRGNVISLAIEEIRLPYEATFPQLYLTAIITGILRSVVADAAALLKGRGRNYYHAVASRPADDPLLQQTVGRLSSIAYVAEASVLGAAEILGKAFDSAIGGVPDRDLFREAALRTAKCKVVVDELALDAATRLFDVGGASAARQSARLDRHWRNIRTISSHNPVSYKARAIGHYEIDGTDLPNAAFF